MKYNDFPLELEEDVKIVKTYITSSSVGEERGNIEYILLDGQKVLLAYRNYYIDKYDEIEDKLTKVQKYIYYAIFTRNYNGYLREKYLDKILENNFYDWIIPYILESSSDYVVEIIEVLYSKLKDQNNMKLKEFCRVNQKKFLTNHTRMVSYWNVYYRKTRGPHFCRYYVGTKLYYECFGYKRSMEKLKSKEIHSKVKNG